MEAADIMEKIISEKFREIDLATYDLKDEFIEFFLKKESKTELNELEKMMIYKAYASNLVIDCDVSELAMNIYKNAWDYLRDSKIQQQVGQNSKYYKYEIILNNKIYRGDTMTSAWISLKKYIQVSHSNILNKDGSVPEKKRKGRSNIEQWKNFIISEFNEGNLVLKDNVLNFLSISNSCGNIIPVPKYFNVGRSGENAEWDYWDLTMICIYSWYLHNDLRILFLNETDDKYLNKLFVKSKLLYESTRECKEWLNIFKTWGNFIEQNFLQDFVYKTDYGFGRPIMFWQNHTFITPIPTNEKEFEDFFNSVNEKIEKRGKRIKEKICFELK